MQDNTGINSKETEDLSAAIDALNAGLPVGDNQDEKLNELIQTAALIKKTTRAADMPPPAILESIINQSSKTIIRERQKKRLAWGFAGLSTAVAAVLVFALVNVIPPKISEQQLAKTPQLPPPVAETQPEEFIAKAPAQLEPAPSTEKPISPKSVKEPAPAAPSPRQSAVALKPPDTPVPAASDSMLAIADRKADVVTIDSVNKVIRQVYRQGAPDEIIITQAPKRQVAFRAAPTQPKTYAKSSATISNEDKDIKAPNRNKVTVTVEEEEVTIEGAGSEEELLDLATKLKKVSVSK